MIFSLWGRASHQPTRDGEPATLIIIDINPTSIIQYPVPVAIETSFHQSTSFIQFNITINWFPVISQEVQVAASPVTVQRDEEVLPHKNEHYYHHHHKHLPSQSGWRSKDILLEGLWQTHMGWTGTCDNIFNHIWMFKHFTGTGINIFNIYQCHCEDC